jgi:hypothetical protein
MASVFEESSSWRLHMPKTVPWLGWRRLRAIAGMYKREVGIAMPKKKLFLLVESVWEE